MRTIVTGAVLIVASLFLAGASGAQTAETVTCKDGTTANAGRGACHGHGGVAKDKSGTSGTSGAAATGGSAATVTCKDGTTATAGRGACHGHGGVAKSGAPAAAAAPAAAPAPMAAASNAGSGQGIRPGKKANTDPNGALARCHDGTYWHGTKHAGSCSHHGGVDTWLDGSK